MKNQLVFVLVLLLTACGDKGTESVREIQVPGETVFVEQKESLIQCQIYQGQASLPSVHQVKGTHLVELESLNFPEVTNDLLPFDAFLGTEAESITNNFAMRCSFKFEVTSAGNHIFKLTSDDGSELYINGVRVINNGGSHGMLMKSTTINLPVGIHELRVTFFEGNGPKGLNLTVQRPNIVLVPETL